MSNNATNAYGEIYRLPIRNWNHFFGGIKFSCSIRYQTTYKELKLYNSVFSIIPSYSYQTTYKELKPEQDFFTVIDKKCYQTTYKELKLSLALFSQYSAFWLSDYL